MTDQEKLLVEKDTRVNHTYLPQHPPAQAPSDQQLPQNYHGYTAIPIDAFDNFSETESNGHSISVYNPVVSGRIPSNHTANHHYKPNSQYGHRPPMRKPTVRHIPLTRQGNLVLNVPVPDRVLQHQVNNVDEEFKYMRYTAVTCNPDDFLARGFSLRQQEWNRHTELFIVITMYNEDEKLFCRSMTAVMNNIIYLCKRRRDSMWGRTGWQKVVVCIVADGRANIDRQVLNVLGIMGVYQDGVMKDHVNEKAVTAHVFEYTTHIVVSPDFKVRGTEEGTVPIQILFCLKEHNAKKINSHRWFFNGFGPLLRPNVCVLIDVGTKPTNTSIYHLWRTFDKYPSVGGACGEIYADLGTCWWKLLNPLVAAQNFEYKMSNILDKPLESVFGYISVLPGAFSAYRYVALQGRPLMQYFKGETMHGHNNIADANMYLAEDRVLCFEIVTKRNQTWYLKYVKSAKAETDVPDKVAEFISQRRRWLNGTFFAGFYSFKRWYDILDSGHNIFRILAFGIQTIYNVIILLLNWIMLSSFYLAFHFYGSHKYNGNISNDPFHGYGDYIYPALEGLYVVSIILVIVSSLGNRPQSSKWIFIFCMWLFAIIMGSMIYASCFNIYLNIIQIKEQWRGIQTIIQFSASRDLLIAFASTFGIYLVSSLIYLDPWHMFTSFIQYMLLYPSYINVLNVYAFCNIHDVTWGTKGDNAAVSLGEAKMVKGKDGSNMVSMELTDRKNINANYEHFIKDLVGPRQKVTMTDSKLTQDDYFRKYRTAVLLSWFFTNGLIIVAFTNVKLSNLIYNWFGVSEDESFHPYLRFLFYTLAMISSIRFLGSMTYIIFYIMRFILRRYFSGNRSNDLLSKFELFPSAENGKKLITSLGSHGLSFANVSFKGPVIINLGRIFLWDVPQFGVGGRLPKTPEVDDPNSPFHEWSWEAFNMFDHVDPSPEILIIGSGAKIFPFPSIFSQKFQKLGIQLEVCDSKNACATYNLLSKEGRLVSCAILPPIPTSAKTGKPVVEVFSSF